MNRERALKIVLGLLGMFVASLIGLLPRNTSAWAQMIISIYDPRSFRIARDPQPVGESESHRLHRLVEFCSRGVIAVQALRNVIPRADLLRAVLPLLIMCTAHRARANDEGK